MANLPTPANSWPMRRKPIIAPRCPLDLMRQGSKQAATQDVEAVSHLLGFEANLICDGRSPPRPVNYLLAGIRRPEGVVIDPMKRSLVVVDARAGHGSEIAGFQPDSPISVILEEDLVGFLPDPVPGQTMEDVTIAEAAFCEHVIALNADGEGKPGVIDNCQAGSECGSLLAEQERIEPPLAPQNAGKIALASDQIVEQAARDILRDCLDQIATNFFVVRKLDDIEGPHQLRVGLRRLRTAFLVYKSALDSTEMARLSGEAKWLGQEVGRLRDLDVVAHVIVMREATLHPDEPGLSALAEVLAKQAAERRDQIRTLLIGTRAQAFLSDLAQFVEMRGWLVPADLAQTGRLAVPVVDLAPRLLNKRWKKVSKAARGLETLTADQRHTLRKELKTLRYAVEFFAPLFPAKRVDPFLKALKTLTTVFGDLNDSATVRAMLADTEPAGLGGWTTQRAVGWVIGASQARAAFAWSRAQALWRCLDGIRPFWK
ncbi:MAG: CHAD domain-containing protein [Mesorhizobium sp.]|uniref:CHAD domain-containing protein n=2 Tax=Mesorhizobium sp. TaxID=1871066 RepID=UPI000FE33012|nr:MAG: CHAD domain-containing protein [Mesorhizobium sp.]TIN76553.1 MAG: CHAD domain-containing protein [Mesorhizobium sp.]